MTLQGVQFVIGKAATDGAFRSRLKTDMDEMLYNVSVRYSHEFTPEEATALKAMDWDGLEGVAHDLDERISRMTVRRGRSLGADPNPTCSCVPPNESSNPDKGT